MLDEERLSYVGSMVLGMNDAMVEMTGTLAGLTLAMQNTRLIALSGLITGIAATLSMASSEYLSSKSEGRPDALKSASYTGVAYLVTVALLILPYLLFDESHYLWAMGTMVVIVLLILVVFNYYLSVAQDLPFKKRFGQMAGISLGVAALSVSTCASFSQICPCFCMASKRAKCTLQRASPGQLAKSAPSYFKISSIRASTAIPSASLPSDR